MADQVRPAGAAAVPGRGGWPAAARARSECGGRDRIPDDVMDYVGKLFEEISVRFWWQKDDMIMLDNMLTTHARDPFEGDRKIVVAMGQMISIEQALATA